MLVIRDLALGRNRFKEFAASPEGIPTNILSGRLERLLQQGIIVQVPFSPEEAMKNPEFDVPSR